MANSPAPTAAAPTAPLALFYRRPVPLTPARHLGMSLATSRDQAFARSCNAVPLTVAEFGAAMRHYPIVFTAAKPTVPVALVGIDDGVNLFVDRAGKWQEGVYIPAYVRRYPFILVAAPAAKELLLAIDEAAGALVPGDENPLFRDGKPTAVIDRALAACGEFQAAFDATRRFCDALEAASLLIDKEAEIELKGGRSKRLTGFRIIDEARLNKLSTRMFLDFRQRGWLRPIYLQLAATHNWASLVDLAATSAS